MATPATSCHRYDDDIALLAALGFDHYRFSLEWSRIEPEPRASSPWPRSTTTAGSAARAWPTASSRSSRSTTSRRPRWAAAEGGWDDPEIVDRFTRFCERAVGHLGDLIGRACTINEPNVVALDRLPAGVLPARCQSTTAGSRRPPTTSSPPTGGSVAGAEGAAPATSRSGSRCRWPTTRPCRPTIAAALASATRSRRGMEDVFLEAAARRRLRRGPDLQPHPGRARRACSAPRRACPSCRWATSTTPRRSRPRSAGRGRSPAAACRSSSPRTASAPTTTPSASTTCAPPSRGCSTCLDDGHRRARLHVLVPARQLRVGLRLRPPLRHRRGRPGHPGAHGEAQRPSGSAQSPGPTRWPALSPRRRRVRWPCSAVDQVDDSGAGRPRG